MALHPIIIDFHDEIYVRTGIRANSLVLRDTWVKKDDGTGYLVQTIKKNTGIKETIFISLKKANGVPIMDTMIWADGKAIAMDKSKSQDAVVIEDFSEETLKNINLESASENIDLHLNILLEKPLTDARLHHDPMEPKINIESFLADVERIRMAALLNKEQPDSLFSFLKETQCADDFGYLRVAGRIGRPNSESFKNIVEIQMNPENWRGFFGSLEENLRDELSELVRSDPIRGRFCYCGIVLMNGFKTKTIGPDPLNPEIVRSSEGDSIDISNCEIIIIGWGPQSLEDEIGAAVYEIATKTTNKKTLHPHNVEASKNRIRWIYYTFRQKNL